MTKDLRRRVRWRELALLREPYGIGFDLIVCSNILIYFADDSKERVLRQYRAALAPGGLSFIRGTESILAPTRLGYEHAGRQLLPSRSAAEPRSRPERTHGLLPIA